MKMKISNISFYNVLLYVNTIKHLKLTQIIWRFWYQLKIVPYAKNVQFEQREPSGKWIQPIPDTLE